MTQFHTIVVASLIVDAVHARIAAFPSYTAKEIYMNVLKSTVLTGIVYKMTSKSPYTWKLLIAISLQLSHDLIVHGRKAGRRPSSLFVLLRDPLVSMLVISIASALERFCRYDVSVAGALALYVRASAIDTIA